MARGRRVRVKRPRRVAQRHVSEPCHACYADRGANEAYCARCITSGAAAFHRGMVARLASERSAILSGEYRDE